MSRQLHINQAAEREANEIAFRFMDSSDVVGDMSRAYGADLSSVRIHTGENAARKVEGTGADALSTGKDIFFGQGVFDQGNPAGRGLLAHELAHSLQQGVGDGMEGAVTQSVPEGAEQGGKITDFFRRLFGGKQTPEPELQISEPELVTGPLNVSMLNDNGDETVRNFKSSRSYALNQMLHGATREQLQNPLLRQMVLDDYNTNMNARLRSMNGKGKAEMDAEGFRGGAGELNSLNIILGSMVPEGFDQQVMNVQKNPDPAVGGTAGALSFMSDYVEQNPELMEFLGGTAASFEGVDYYESAGDRSAMMMNNFLLRTVNSKIGREYGAQQRAAKAAGKEDPDKGDLIRSMKLQKELNKGSSQSAARMRGLLARLMGGR